MLLITRLQVCAVEPLSFGLMEHPLKNFCIAALATLSKFIVVTIRPRLKVIKFHPLTGPGECLPLLAWQMVLIQSADTTRVVDPVLAAVRGNNLFFHQVKNTEIFFYSSVKTMTPFLSVDHLSIRSRIVNLFTSHNTNVQHNCAALDGTKNDSLPGHQRNVAFE